MPAIPNFAGIAMKFLPALFIIACALPSIVQAQEPIIAVMNRLPNIDKLIDITLNPVDAAKLRGYFQKRLEEAGDTATLSEKEELCSQEIIDFMAEKQVPFYGFFDWKQESTSLDWFVKTAIKKNVDSTIVFESGCDLKELSMLYQAVKCYAAAVRRAGLQLCYMDIDSDSYQLFVIRPEDHERLKELVTNIGFKLRDDAQEW